MLQQFSDALGTLPVCQLTQKHLDDWIDSMRQWRTDPVTKRVTRWNDGMVRTVATYLHACR